MAVALWTATAVTALQWGAVTADAAETAKPRTVKVRLTKRGCPTKLTVPSGPVTFAVKNVAIKGVSEFEVLQGPNVIGEVEDISRGSTSPLTLTLDPGEYRTQCLDAKGIPVLGRLVVVAPA